ncbi:MAG: MATE family efflux transporter [Anaerolineae bacterium]|nr:MAG: MATE family efflux transporter [Anaerolineae bacterium]
MLKALRRLKTRPTNRHDITRGSLVGNIWQLAWPITLSQLLFMAPDLYDAVWLGRLGSEAQAAAGLATSARITMISVLMALSGGSGAVVARYVGAKDQENANLAALQAVILMVLASGGLGVVGVIFAEPLMRLVGADATVLPLAVRYARILFAGLIAMEMVPSVGGMLNAAGAPGVGLTMRLWSMGTMLVAEPLLVKWLGLEGAVLALVGSNVVGTLWGLGVLVAGRATVRIDVHNLRLDFPMMRRILRIALPAILQCGTPNLAMSLLMRLVSSYGATTLAAWVVARRVLNFAQMPSMGLARVTPAMVGQNLGAGQPQRAERAVSLIARTVVGVTVVVLGGLVLFAPQVMALVSEDAGSISAGVHIIRALSLGYLAFALNGVYDAAQTGAGDTVSPMAINVIALWLVQIPLAYLLSRTLGLGANGVWLALVIGWFAQAALKTWRYRQGHWKSKQI